MTFLQKHHNVIRFLRGAFWAPWALPVLAIGFVLLRALFLGDHSSVHHLPEHERNDFWDYFLYYAYISYWVVYWTLLFSYPVMVFFMLPYAVTLYQLDVLTFWKICFGFSFINFIFITMIAIVFGAPNIWTATVSLGVGFVMGAVFCWLAEIPFRRQNV